MQWQSSIAQTLQWSGEIVNREAKQQAAMSIASKVSNGDVIGIGSGSTVFLSLQAIARRLQDENIHITGIPTSHEVALACMALGIPTTSLLASKPDWAFDGADEVDPDNNLIKGRGGALFKEKILIVSSPKTYIVVDKSKLVHALGQKFPIPVEVYPLSVHYVESRLMQLGAFEVKLRLAKAKDGPVITEAGNFILDARFVNVASDLECRIKEITGVLESGLFQGYNVEIITT
jgi:ribose 5-phosphate isomerase A